MSSTRYAFAAQLADHVGDLVDGISEITRQESSLSATRALYVEDARRLTVVTEQATAGLNASEWSIEHAAHRVLVSELATALTLPESTIESLVTDSEILVNDLPATFESLSFGAISWRHAQIVASQAASLPTEARAAFEERVLPFALTHTSSRFNRYAREQRERMHPDSIEERHETAASKRSVDLQPGSDGMAWLTAFLPAPTAHAIFDRLTDAAQLAVRDGDARTLGQLRADAFAGALLGSTYSASDTLGTPDLRAILATIRPSVDITVPILTLLDRGDEPAVLDGFGPIDLETASLLASTAPNFMRLLTQPETGAVLSVGRDRYQIPADLRRWLQIRDGTCRFPGCGRAARRCDVDHTDEWQHGGDTAHDNLAHLCRKHHRLKSLTEWKVEQVGDGALRWTSPLGKIYLTEPAETIATRLARDGTNRAA